MTTELHKFYDALIDSMRNGTEWPDVKWELRPNVTLQDMYGNQKLIEQAALFEQTMMPLMLGLENKLRDVDIKVNPLDETLDNGFISVVVPNGAFGFIPWERGADGGFYTLGVQMGMSSPDDDDHTKELMDTIVEVFDDYSAHVAFHMLSP